MATPSKLRFQIYRKILIYSACVFPGWNKMNFCEKKVDFATHVVFRSKTFSRVLSYERLPIIKFKSLKTGVVTTSYKNFINSYFFIVINH